MVFVLVSLVFVTVLSHISYAAGFSLGMHRALGKFQVVLDAHPDETQIAISKYLDEMRPAKNKIHPWPVIVWKALRGKSLE